MNEWISYGLMAALLLVGGAKIYYLTAIYRQRMRAWKLSQPKSDAATLEKK